MINVDKLEMLRKRFKNVCTELRDGSQNGHEDFDKLKDDFNKYNLKYSSYLMCKYYKSLINEKSSGYINQNSCSSNYAYKIFNGLTRMIKNNQKDN